MLSTIGGTFFPQVNHTHMPKVLAIVDLMIAVGGVALAVIFSSQLSTAAQSAIIGYGLITVLALALTKITPQLFKKFCNPEPKDPKRKK